MEPAMSDDELREYDAERAIHYQEVQAWERAQGQIETLTAERDEARAGLARLRAEHAAALDAARREGAEGMREACMEACREALRDPIDIAIIGRVADAIRTLPLDAPGGGS
jgi:hypothetical protein